MKKVGKNNFFHINSKVKFFTFLIFFSLNKYLLEGKIFFPYLALNFFILFGLILLK